MTRLFTYPLRKIGCYHRPEPMVGAAQAMTGLPTPDEPWFVNVTSQGALGACRETPAT
jgi:hypothetical protein